jgi:hypothetical protein
LKYQPITNKEFDMGKPKGDPENDGGDTNEWGAH